MYYVGMGLLLVIKETLSASFFFFFVKQLSLNIKSNFKVEQSFGVRNRNIEAAIAQHHVIDGQQEVADVLLQRFTK